MNKKLALARLNEFPDYYTRSKKMEQETEAAQIRKYLSMTITEED